MKNRFWNFLLLGSLMGIVADDKKAGGGGGGSETETAEQDPAKPSTEAPERPAEASLADRVLGSIKSKGSLIAERNDFRQRAETAEAALAKIQGEHTTATAELTTLRADQQRISEALATAESEKTTVSEAATEQLAALGVKSEELATVSKNDGDDFESRYQAAKAGEHAGSRSIYAGEQG